MTTSGWLQIVMYLLVVLAITAPLGRFLTRVFQRERTLLDPVLRPVERLIYRLTGVDETREMRWTEYATAMLAFSVVSMLQLYALQRLQGRLPWNPQKLGAVAPSLAFNTAASFATNTNWQAYSGETTMSYLTQMAGLAYHNFASAAVGIALAIAFIRGVAQRERDTLGNFWVDFVRGSLWVLLPFCLVGALALVSQGVVQNLKPYDMRRPTRSLDRRTRRSSRRVPSRHRKSSRRGEPTAGDSSTRTARTRSRIRRRCRTSWRWSRSSPSLRVSRTRSAT